MREKNKLIMMRGLPSSGKSFTAQSIKKKLEANGGSLVNISSTDDWFTVNKIYQFDPVKLPEYHARNLCSVHLSMNSHVSCVIVDNTNVKSLDMLPYLVAAQVYGYQVEICEPDSPWWKATRQIPFREYSTTEQWNIANRLMQKNSHNVPASVIYHMMLNWEDENQFHPSVRAIIEDCN